MEHGRPAMYKTVKELEDKIDDYFDNAVGWVKDTTSKGRVKKDAEGEDLMKMVYPTVSGLALFLGFADRQSIYDYKKKDGFACIIKRAILKMESTAEQDLLVPGNHSKVGTIFWLKNHNWKDKQEITGGDGESLLGGLTINVLGEQK